MICGTQMPETNDAQNPSNQQYADNSNYQYDEQNQGNNQNYQNISTDTNSRKPSKGLVIALCTMIIMLTGAVASFATILVLNGGSLPADSKTESAPVEEKEPTPQNNNKETKYPEEPISEPIVVTEETLEGVQPSSEPAQKKPSGYGTYTNSTYGFYCAYPLEFSSVSPSGANVLKQYVSDDGTAVMKIRATRNTSNMTIAQALNDFYNAYDGEITYKASKNTWYAVSIILPNGRALYRKLFMKNNNIYCMDFETDYPVIDKYRKQIEYIEDNFKAY